MHDAGVWHGDGGQPTPQDAEMPPDPVGLAGGGGLQAPEELPSRTAESKHIKILR